MMCILVGECQDWETHAKGSQRKLSDLERELHTVSSQLAGNREAKSESAELRKSLERLRASLEEQQEESTELISRVTAQSAEIVQLQGMNVELQSKLSMAELLTQQV
jgi:predicted nuclease with TOPRIM domain